MPGAWITDLRHYLTPDGSLPELPGPVLGFALFLGSIVAWVTSHPAPGHTRTNVPCRRRPGRRRCVAEIVARLRLDGETIAWQCPLCGDHGLIYGWQGTWWDRRGE